MTVLIIGFYLSRTENYNYGGNTVALRWAIWLVPFWLLAMLPILDAFGSRRWFRILSIGLLAVSTFSAWEAIGNPWRPSWLYGLMEDAGWIDYTDRDPALPRPLSTWFASLPPADSDPQHEWIELRATTDTGEELLRLELVEADANRPRVRLIETLLTSGVPAKSIAVTATIDRAQFEAGEDPQAFVADGEPSSALAAYVLRQLPGQVTYRPGHVRYQKTSLREFAFQTQHVTAAIDARRPTGEIIRHRLDAWLCDDVPFGVVRLRETLTEARSGDWLSQRDFVLTAAGRLDDPEWVSRVKAQIAE